MAVLITATAKDKVARKRTEERAQERMEDHLNAERKHRELELARIIEIENNGVEHLDKPKKNN